MKKLKILVFSWFLIQPFLGLSQEQKIISLNGNWEIVFDHNNQGANQNWQEDEVFQTLKNKKPISIPSSWELIEEDYEGLAFYRYAFMNLLPIPALDGGHVMFLLYEMISGRKPNEKFMEYAQMVGFFLILALVLYANGNESWRLYPFKCVYQIIKNLNNYFEEQNKNSNTCNSYNQKYNDISHNRLRL